ncbi:MAG: ring-cleaving dioxygenase, partial [Luteitalea sp.]|nr:ring-cleaving dioxygenase [Luteitalea sp.]
MHSVTGLHHVTAIAGPAQENLDFYSGVLGLRLVKKSVNQDDPGTYHLFYADAEGRPGTDLTFFPWAQLAPSRQGHGLSVEVQLAIPPGSMAYWGDRLEGYGTHLGAAETRFGERVLPLIDPHGLNVALVESDGAVRRPFSPWHDSPVPAEHQVRGLHGARLWEQRLARTTTFLEEVLGFSLLGTESGWHRYVVRADRSGQPERSDGEAAPSGRFVDIQERADIGRGAWGTGSIHHLAWRVDDEQHQLDMRSRIEAGGRRPTPVIDRFWFRSVYFLEPGGVLFELATDGPGFSVDEDVAHLGETLVLPPWLEPSRSAIEAKLPAVEKRLAQHVVPQRA